MIHHKVKILYIQYRTFGDVLVSNAIVNKLKEKYPNSVIDYWTLSNCVDLIVTNENIGRVYTELQTPKNVSAYDIVLRPYKCLQESGGWHTSGKHFLDLYAELCGVELKGNYMFLFKNIQKIPDETMESFGKYVLIQCKTNDSAKDWSRFKELVLLIKEKFGFEVIQIGGVGDGIVPGAKSLLGMMPFPKTAYLIQKAVTTVCLDSAIQHLAGAIFAPYIALYGAKDSKLVRSGIEIGIGLGDEIFFEKIYFQYALDPPNRGECEKACYMANCQTGKKCIDNIEPETVLGLIEKTING